MDQPPTRWTFWWRYPALPLKCQGMTTFPFLQSSCSSPDSQNTQSALRCKYFHDHTWFVVLTHLKNISQIGSFPQIGMKIKNIWKHHLDTLYHQRPGRLVQTSARHLYKLMPAHLRSPDRMPSRWTTTNQHGRLGPKSGRHLFWKNYKNWETFKCRLDASIFPMHSVILGSFSVSWWCWRSAWCSSHQSTPKVLLWNLDEISWAQPAQLCRFFHSQAIISTRQLCGCLAASRSVGPFSKSQLLAMSHQGQRHPPGHRKVGKKTRPNNDCQTSMEMFLFCPRSICLNIHDDELWVG